MLRGRYCFLSPFTPPLLLLSLLRRERLEKRLLHIPWFIVRNNRSDDTNVGGTHGEERRRGDGGVLPPIRPARQCYEYQHHAGLATVQQREPGEDIHGDHMADEEQKIRGGAGRAPVGVRQTDRKSVV